MIETSSRWWNILVLQTTFWLLSSPLLLHSFLKRIILVVLIISGQFLYKMISKIIACQIKKILSNHISPEHFGFLRGRQIHDAIGLAQGELHTIQKFENKAVVFKVDLSKDFDKVNWLYIRLLLLHLGFTMILFPGFTVVSAILPLPF